MLLAQVPTLAGCFAWLKGVSQMMILQTALGWPLPQGLVVLVALLNELELIALQVGLLQLC